MQIRVEHVYFLSFEVKNGNCQYLYHFFFNFLFIIPISMSDFNDSYENYQRLKLPDIKTTIDYNYQFKATILERYYRIELPTLKINTR